jgi:hypothetical protein
MCVLIEAHDEWQVRDRVQIDSADKRWVTPQFPG